MQNYQTPSTVKTTVFTGTEATAITEGRKLQTEANNATLKNVSYTIGTNADGETELYKHEVWGGGTPPYQGVIQDGLD